MKRFVLSLALVLVSVSIQAQLLWKVRGNGLEKESYILGTMHNAPASMIDEIPGMQQALEGCDVVVGEMDMNNLGLNLQGLDIVALAAKLEAPRDSTLDKLFSPEDYQMIEQVYKEKCGDVAMPFALMMFYKPAFVELIITQFSLLGDAGVSDVSQYIDMAVQLRAQEMGRQSMGLETLMEQLGFLFDIPIAEQAQELLKTCISIDFIDELESMLYEPYINQDLARIESLYFDPQLGNGEKENDRLVVRRNLNWVDKLVKMMPERSCLVCVGAAHLIGQQGLLQLFRDRGYTVEPMK